MNTQKNESNQQSLLRVDEVASLLGLSCSRIRYEVFLGRIPFIKIGRTVRFHPEEIENWIFKSSKGGKNER